VGSNKKFSGQEFSVKHVVAHEDYDAEEVFNDIALVSLSSPMSFSDRVGPVCLPKKPTKDYAGQGLIVSGWGITLNGTTANDLQVVKDITILDDCQG
jgi:Trypsin